MTKKTQTGWLSVGVLACQRLGLIRRCPTALCEARLVLLDRTAAFDKDDLYQVGDSSGVLKMVWIRFERRDFLDETWWLSVPLCPAAIWRSAGFNFGALEVPS